MPMVSLRVIHTSGMIRSWLAGWLGSAPPAFENVICGPVQIVAASAARLRIQRPSAKKIAVTACVVDFVIDMARSNSRSLFFEGDRQPDRSSCHGMVRRPHQFN